MFIPHKLILRNIMAYELLEYNFKQDANIVVGENLDDPGQRGNGSGKSGIAEGIALAATGNTIRKIKTKEIVRRGAESGEVELHLYNAMYRCEIKIWRRVNVTSKSSEYRMWIDGKEQDDCYSDFNTFNDYVFQMLGISKDDFFSFYLMTLADYKPFLNTGDTEKKRIINRFSGAYKVDLAIPFVEQDIQAADDKVKAIDREIAGIKSKQEVIADEIREEQKLFSDEGKKEKVTEYNERIKEIVDHIQVIREDQVEDEKMLKESREELFELEMQDETKNRKESEATIAEAIAERSEVDAQSKGKLEALKQANKLKAELEVGLAGLIECPNCHHTFNLQDKDFNIEEAQEALKQLATLIPDIEGEIDELDTLLSDYGVAIREAQDALTQSEADNRKRKRQVNANIENAEDTIRKFNKKVKQLEEEMQEAANKRDLIQSGKSEKLDKLNERLLNYIDDETEMREKLSVAMVEKVEVEKWLTNFKNFKSYLANKSIKNIQDYTNMYLQSMGTNLSIKIDGYRMLANKKLKEEITTEVLRDGFPVGSYGSFSAGERGRIDVACILAIQSLINLNSTTGGLDLCICDEILDSVDSLGLELLVGSLQSVRRTIMIVSQQEINALNEHTLKVRKQNGLSKII